MFHDEEGKGMLEWLEWLADGILALGYVGVYVALVIEGLGLPFPGDGMMAFYGFACARGDMRLPMVLTCSVMGYVTGTTLAYLFSHGYGRKWLERVGPRLFLSEQNIDRTAQLLERYGAWLLIPGRFLPGIRSVSSYAAGLASMDFRHFLLYTVVGAALWCTAWVGVGYWFGENVETVMSTIQSGLAYLTGAVVLALLGVWFYRRKVRS